jgi:hypothetical protein
VSQAKDSGRQLSARERARLAAAEQAEQFETRQRRLRELAVDYLLAGEELGKAVESVERRMVPLRREVAAAQEKARRSRYGTVARMRELEAPESEIAARLGVSLGEVRRAMAQVRAWQADSGDPDTDPGAESGAGSVGRAVESGGDTDRDIDRDGGGELPPLPVGLPVVPELPDPDGPDGGAVEGLEGWQAPWPAEPGRAR